jgi:hypothetical protein
MQRVGHSRDSITTHPENDEDFLAFLEIRIL